jgi:hypothetical protein
MITIFQRSTFGYWTAKHYIELPCFQPVYTYSNNFSYEAGNSENVYLTDYQNNETMMLKKQKAGESQ